MIYSGPQAWQDAFFRTLLFKIFNKESTWRLLSRELGEVCCGGGYTFEAYDRVLSAAFARGAGCTRPPTSFRHRIWGRAVSTAITCGCWR